MRIMAKQTAFLVIVLGALAVPQTARAGAKEEARKHYDRAIGAPDGQAATPSTHMHLMAAVGRGFAGFNAGGTW
jgi:hypothetical protein